MDYISVRGGKPLRGNILISGSKNATLPIMASCLLTDEEIILRNVPKLSDITTMKDLLRNHGTTIETEEENGSFKLKIRCSFINNFTAPYDIVCKMRASIWVLGPLLARFGEAKVSLPGGCAIGTRLVDLHLSILESMGATLEIKNGYIEARVKGKLKGTRFDFDKISVGATVTGISAAVLASGETILLNCAKEPEIIDLCEFLVSAGARIYGIGTDELRITGVNYLSGTDYSVSSDRIEAGTYMIAAAITKGDLNILGIKSEVLENLSFKLIKAGIEVSNIENGINVKYSGKISSVDMQTGPYPGFATDLQAQFTALMTLCEGTSVITETIFENRFMHVPELCRMGADISINGNNVVIRGVRKLRGAPVMASDLRASVSLVLAGLAAEGETLVRRIYHIDRGYQSIEEKLIACGASVYRLKDAI